MRRCPPDPSLGHPVAFWKNTDYALFKNGVIATFTPGENEIEELGSHYDMFYYDSKMVTELDLSRPDIISKSELVLVDLRFKWAVTALILFLALIFEQLSTNPIHNLQQIFLRFIPSFNDQWAAILNILILLFMFSDYYITRLIFNHKNKHHTISITHNLRKNKIILTQYPGNLTQLTAIITQTTRLAVGIAFLMIGVGDSVVETTFTLALGLILMIVSLSLLIALLTNDSSKSTFFAMYDHSKKVEVLETGDFFEELVKLRKNELEAYNRVDFNSKSLIELLKSNESANLEFKASMWTRYKTKNKIATQEIVVNPVKGPNYKDPILEDEVLHTVAAFLNTLGGTLLIGVKDKPASWGDRTAEVFGVENDYSILGKNKGADEYVRSIFQILERGFVEKSKVSNVSITIEQFEGKDICRIDVIPLPKIRNGELYIIERSDPKEETRFYVRTGTSSQKQSIETAVRYISTNFPPPNSEMS